MGGLEVLISFCFGRVFFAGYHIRCGEQRVEGKDLWEKQAHTIYVWPVIQADVLI